MGALLVLTALACLLRSSGGYTIRREQAGPLSSHKVNSLYLGLGGPEYRFAGPSNTEAKGKTLAQTRKLAATADKLFQKMLNCMATKDPSIVVKHADIKSEDRMKEKMIGRSSPTDYTQLQDVCRASILFPDMASLCATSTKFLSSAQACSPGVKLVENDGKSLFVEPHMCYGDIKTWVSFGGYYCELAIKLKSVESDERHDLYKLYRTATDESKKDEAWVKGCEFVKEKIGLDASIKHGMTTVQKKEVYTKAAKEKYKCAATWKTN